MDFLLQYWFVIVGSIAVVGLAILIVRWFFSLTGDQQLSNIKNWLLWAVTQAEKNLGAGTGRLKLAMVYDLFVGKFPAVAKVLTFDTFSSLVDDALEEMRKLLNSNRAIAELLTTKL